MEQDENQCGVPLQVGSALLWPRFAPFSEDLMLEHGK